MVGLQLFAILSVLYSAVQSQAPKHWGTPRFVDKVALVTGGDSGIGLATVQAFYYECADVVIVGHSPSKVDKAVADLTEMKPQPTCPHPPRAMGLAVDITNTSEVEMMIPSVLEVFAKVDIAVNNAGIGGTNLTVGQPGFLDTFGDPRLDAVTVNEYGSMKCMHYELQYWVQNNIPGIMVNVASICGTTAWCQTLYGASKWALVGITQEVALMYGPMGIRANVLAPGAVNTTMLRDGRAPDDPTWIAEKKMIESMIPSGHIAEPWEMAGTITFLASDMANYVNGAVLVADGGMSMAPPGFKSRGLFH